MTSELDVLSGIIRPRPATRLRPRAFFTAWSGVLTFAFDGFSETLLSIKREIERSIPGLRPEYPGSRWPKVTLAALNEGRTLTRAEARILLDLCAAWNEAVGPRLHPQTVEALSVVVYLCRSLEKRVITHRIPLEGGPPDPDDAPPPAHRAQVEHILRQFTEPHLDHYLDLLTCTEHDVEYYRAYHPGTTLVYDLPPGALPFLDAFTQAVEERLPGYYGWFTPESRHVTLRTLMHTF
ncbi:hypothetical protein [Rhodocaloribacter sp.]